MPKRTLIESIKIYFNELFVEYIEWDAWFSERAYIPLGFGFFKLADEQGKITRDAKASLVILLIGALMLLVISALGMFQFITEQTGLKYLLGDMFIIAASSIYFEIRIFSRAKLVALVWLPITLAITYMLFIVSKLLFQ
jgi:hypothetical protein